MLKPPIPKNIKELITYRKRMNRYKDYIFIFLYFLDVPPDKKGSKRATRNIKAKQKASGQFKSEHG